ncbi:anthranilate synthase family protein [Streptomyces sp. HNM0574]|uniref:anthranilate synthase family protein n=1 Tax=Streptomyces sp. HNM0574 TaxID=2714954 RepID=UPI001469CDEE|nr:anthranilate synthase family protein [Streptomyces sp. HNM0574]NLU67662.1 phenazine-specific anthranilate synthase component I [Streptomyces sp. HNM0574]
MPHPSSPEVSPERLSADAAAGLIAALLRDDAPPFALLRRRTPGRDADTVEVLTGPVTEVEELAAIPSGPLGALALVPFRQIRERGFDVRDDGTPLSVLVPERIRELPLESVLEALPGHRVRVEGGAFDVGDAEYEEIVRRVVEDEIGAGEGANFVVQRSYRAGIPGFSRADALALFGRLLRGEQGAYWTFVVHTGKGAPPARAERSGVRGWGRALVGASPEVHVRMSGDTVVMNPISGTYRYPPEGPSPEELLEFLADRKESEELSMVVDEELKMMCAVGDRGGVVVGPRLKEMAHLAHTEYELRGRSTWDVRDVLRETMFAATVTGSPVENACRVIERHEPAGPSGTAGRGYYAGALALIGPETGEAAGRSLDSPILIRTADIDAATGALRLSVGATLVRASDPASEVAETYAKAAGVLTALGVREGARRAPREGARLAEDPRVLAALEARRADLAPFWLRMRTAEALPEPRGRVLVVDGEDTFTSMLRHLLRSTGYEVTVLRYDEPGLREAALSFAGPVVLGPGPGDPGDERDPKMRFLRGLAADLVRAHRGASGRPSLLGVCLGHELLAAELGLEIVRKERPFQGAQERIDLFGQRETVGFYNSYSARCDDEAAAELALHHVELSRDEETGEVHALRGPGFAGVQFHPESVLTLDGVGITARLLEAVLV